MMKSKRRLIIILTAALLIAAGTVWMRWRPAKRFEFSSLGSDQLRIVTWNVGYFAAVSDKNLRNVDLSSISKLLNEVDSDIVVLQELRSAEQAETIRLQLGKGWEASAVMTGHGNQVLAVMTRLSRKTVETFKCGGRKVIATSLISRSGDGIYFVGVHSPHPARGKDATVKSIRCALSLAKERDERIKIIAGDMNYNFDPEATDNSLYTQIRVYYGDSTIGLGETYYAHTRIDQVFHHPKSLRVMERESGILDLPMRIAKVPGFRDHRPIVVTYDLRRKDNLNKGRAGS